MSVRLCSKKVTWFGSDFSNEQQLGLPLPHILSLGSSCSNMMDRLLHAVVVPMPDILHGRVLFSLEKVLRARLNRGIWELLVKWTSHSEAGTTWEQLKEFKH
jgi:hypothetical protein